MARRTEIIFLLYAVAVTLLTLGVAILYPLSIEMNAFRYALLAALFVTGIARVGGRTVGAVASFVASGVFGLGMLVVPGTSVATLDASVGFLVMFAVTGGLSFYAGQLRRCEIEVSQHEREAAMLARLSLDLLPSAIRLDDVGQLANRVKSIIPADDVLFLVPSEDGELVPWLDPVSSDRVETDRETGVARMVFDSASAGGESCRLSPPQTPSEVGSAHPGSLVSSREAYVPMRSAAGVEGVLFARRKGTPRSRWGQRDEAFLDFVASLVGTLIDRDRLESQAMNSRAIEEADRLKASIISSVSHDLKTPLAAIVATVTGLLGADRSGSSGYLDQRAELESAVGNLQTLNRRIGELIDVSRLEAAGWKPHLEWNDVGDLFHIVREQLGRDGDRVVQELPQEPIVGYFDLTQLARAVFHLVENALSYGPDDSPVVMGAELHDDVLDIWVEDDGPGVPESERSLIFEKFRRGSVATSFPGGTGLGLSVVTGIVQAHRGTVEVADVTPLGSRFTISIPTGSEVRE